MTLKKMAIVVSCENRSWCSYKKYFCKVTHKSGATKEGAEHLSRIKGCLQCEYCTQELLNAEAVE